MSFENEKRGVHTFKSDKISIDANNDDLINGVLQLHARWNKDVDKTNRPTSHRCYTFVTKHFPTVANYTADLAPIGSTFHEFSDADGNAVTGYQCRVKTDATTIQGLTNEVRQLDQLAGTVLTDGASVDSYIVHVDGLTASAGILAKGTVLTMTPTGGSATAFTVVEDATIASNECDVVLDARITIADGIAVTITSYNFLSTDTTVTVDSTGAAIVILLPLAASAKGCILHVISIVDSSTNTVTIDGNGAELIDGAATQVLNALYESISIVSTGTDWRIITDNR